VAKYFYDVMTNSIPLLSVPSRHEISAANRPSFLDVFDFLQLCDSVTVKDLPLGKSSGSCQ